MFIKGTLLCPQDSAGRATRLVLPSLEREGSSPQCPNTTLPRGLCEDSLHLIVVQHISLVSSRVSVASQRTWFSKRRTVKWHQQRPRNWMGQVPAKQEIQQNDCYPPVSKNKFCVKRCLINQYPLIFTVAKLNFQRSACPAHRFDPPLHHADKGILTLQGQRQICPRAIVLSKAWWLVMIICDNYSSIW